METAYVSIHRWLDKDNLVYIYNGILFGFIKERDPAICDNMDESGGHYTKWNKPDTERQILYDLTYM